MLRLLVIIRQEGSALCVSGLGLLLAEGELTALRYSGAHDERQAEQCGHNDEGKDPLESNDLALELSNAQGRRQEAEPEAKDVVLLECQFGDSAGEFPAAKTHMVNYKEEQAVDQERPDEDVGENPSNQAALMRYHDGTVPVCSKSSVRIAR